VSPLDGGSNVAAPSSGRAAVSCRPGCAGWPSQPSPRRGDSSAPTGSAALAEGAASRRFSSPAPWIWRSDSLRTGAVASHSAVPPYAAMNCSRVYDFPRGQFGSGRFGPVSAPPDPNARPECAPPSSAAPAAPAALAAACPASVLYGRTKIRWRPSVLMVLTAVN
jgi:hypothetical protein